MIKELKELYWLFIGKVGPILFIILCIIGLIALAGNGGGCAHGSC